VRKGKENKLRISERRGLTSLLRPTAPIVWIHGASVGESLSALSLIERLLELRPDIFILVTTGTITSAELMESRLPARAFHQFIPLDHPFYVRRFLKHWKPSAVFWLESEFWPNLLVESGKHDIPMALINARMSEGSFERWRLHKWAIAPILGRFQICLGQTDAVTLMLERLGAARAETSGNLKFAAEDLPDTPDERLRFEKILNDRPVLAAIQTIAGEEEMIGRVHLALEQKYPGLITILAPRHPERGPEIQGDLVAQGISTVCRSQGHLPDSQTQVYLADTMGELGLFYRLSETVFLGRSMVSGAGGSNSLEPARLGCAVIQGPYTDNFEEITDYLKQHDAIEIVATEEELLEVLDRNLGNPDRRRAKAIAAKGAASKGDGVLDFVCETLSPLVPMDGDLGGPDARS
jgi:3-deoxy-D-manno-octulosonic-acid transferase